MSGEPDPKAGRRIVEPGFTRALMLANKGCASCGHPATNWHHVLQKGAPHYGDDVYENLLPICGTGTMRCHGAFHGNSYTVEVGESEIWAGPGPTAYSVRPLIERRDQEWVARQLGLHIATHRLDVAIYVFGKLGEGPGREYLKRAYYLELQPS